MKENIPDHRLGIDFIYNKAMEITDNGNLPDGFDWDTFEVIFSAIKSKGGQFSED